MERKSGSSCVLKVASEMLLALQQVIMCHSFTSMCLASFFNTVKQSWCHTLCYREKTKAIQVILEQSIQTFILKVQNSEFDQNEELSDFAA